MVQQNLDQLSCESKPGGTQLLEGSTRLGFRKPFAIHEARQGFGLKKVNRFRSESLVVD